MTRETSNQSNSPAPTVIGRAPVRHDGPEVRAKITEDLYEALQREAGSRRLSVAECVRQILHAHYDRAAGSPPELIRRLDSLTSALEQAQSERELLVGMIDLMYKGLLIRLERPTEREVERRAEEAADGYEKWKLALERHLDDGAFEDLLRLVEAVPNT